MPKVSVIIPVYNTEKYLERCLDSVCNQTLPDIEIICIDDCSTDNSLEILQKYAQKDKRIKLIEFKENKGAASARNKGIDDAKGEYLGFVDSDDYIDLDFYEKLYSKIKKSNAHIIKSNLSFENNALIDSSTEYHNFSEIRESKTNFNHIPTAIFNRTFLKKHSISFPEKLHCLEDSLFELKASFFANKIELVEETYYHYVFNNSSLNNSLKYSDKKLRNLSNSLSLIVEFLNSVDIAEEEYLNIVEKRYNILNELFIQKYNGTIENIDFHLKNIKKIKSNIKYELKTDNIDKIYSFKICQYSKTPKSGAIIPKKIFYVWFGDKKTAVVNMCLQNWRDFMPDYELIEINEHSKYFDFKYEYENNVWFREVYNRKLWAFVSDYARCKVLYDYGGVYLDTDITLIKNLEPILNNSFVIGEQRNGDLGVGIFACVKKYKLLEDVLKFYNEEIFNSPLYIITDIFTDMLKNNNYNDMIVYNKEYFYPYFYNEDFSPECVKENTYAIHWWGASWVNPEAIYFLDNKHKMSLDEIDNSWQKNKTQIILKERAKKKWMEQLKLKQEGKNV